MTPADNSRLANLCGQFNEHIKHIEKRLGIEITNRGNRFKLEGAEPSINAASAILKKLFVSTASSQITPEQIHLSLQESSVDQLLQQGEAEIETRDRIKCKGAWHRSF